MLHIKPIIKQGTGYSGHSKYTGSIAPWACCLILVLVGQISVASASQEQIDRVLDSEVIKSLNDLQKESADLSQVALEQYAIEESPAKKKIAPSARQKTQEKEIPPEVEADIAAYLRSSDVNQFNVLINPIESALIFEARQAAAQGRILKKFQKEPKMQRKTPYQELSEAEADNIPSPDIILRLGYVIYSSPDDWSITINGGKRLNPKAREFEFGKVDNVRYPYADITVDASKDERISQVFQGLMSEGKKKPGYNVKIQGTKIHLRMFSGDCFSLTNLNISPCQ